MCVLETTKASPSSSIQLLTAVDSDATLKDGNILEKTKAFWKMQQPKFKIQHIIKTRSQQSLPVLHCELYAALVLNTNVHFALCLWTCYHMPGSAPQDLRLHW